MGLVAYWGDGGQYGPFDVQEDGWPHAGQVQRFFRIKKGLSAKEFGRIYGAEVSINGEAISERWIREMEQENKVPVDINRRRIIARLLGIPPALLGLATLEDITSIPPVLSSPPVLSAPGALKGVDIDKFRSNIQQRWKLHATSNAATNITAIHADLFTLISLADQAKGDLLYQVRELAFSNYNLAAVITRKQGLSQQAHHYANEAVHVAEKMDDPEILSSALFTRGFENLVSGLYNTVNKHGMFVTDKTYLTNAIYDFENAKDRAHPQLQGLLATHSSRAYAALYQINTTFTTLDDAYQLVGKENIDDLYIRTLLTGTYTGFHEGRYYTDRACALNAAGFPGQALKSLNALKTLEQNTYGKDEMPRFAWVEIITAQSYLAMKNYEEAVHHTKQALTICKDTSSISNIRIITDIHYKIQGSPYGKTEDAQELGTMLGIKV